MDLISACFKSICFKNQPKEKLFLSIIGDNEEKKPSPEQDKFNTDNPPTKSDGYYHGTAIQLPIH